METRQANSHFQTKFFMRHLFMLCLLFAVCSLSGNAQDVIVKKDGSTVVCRIVELTATEAVYQKWNASNNYNYVMNLSDIKVINYQDGRRWTSEGTTYNNSLTPQSNDYNAGTQMNEAQLYALDNRFREYNPNIDYAKKAKRLKRAAWTTGGICLLGGIILMSSAEAVEDSYDGAAYNWSMGGPGLVLIGISATMTPILLKKAAYYRRIAAKYSVNSAPIFEKEITLRNGNRLCPAVDMLSSQVQKKPSLGLGLRYSF